MLSAPVLIARKPEFICLRWHAQMLCIGWLFTFLLGLHLVLIIIRSVKVGDVPVYVSHMCCSCFRVKQLIRCKGFSKFYYNQKPLWLSTTILFLFYSGFREGDKLSLQFRTSSTHGLLFHAQSHHKKHHLSAWIRNGTIYLRVTEHCRWLYIRDIDSDESYNVSDNNFHTVSIY